MTLPDFLKAAAVCTLLLGWGWMAKDYEMEHKPQAQEMWAWVQYDKCRDDVEVAQRKVCTDLQIPHEQCPIDLSQCDKWKEKE